MSIRARQGRQHLRLIRLPQRHLNESMFLRKLLLRHQDTNCRPYLISRQRFEDVSDLCLNHDAHLSTAPPLATTDLEEIPSVQSDESRFRMLHGYAKRRK